MANEVDNIEVRFSAVGNAAVVTAFEQVSTSSVKSEQAIKKFDTSMKAANDNASKAARAFGVFATSASALDPVLGKLGSTAMRTAETITTFGTYLGGPWGIALGAAVAGVALLTKHLHDNAEAAKANALAMLEAADADAEFNRQVAAAYARNPTTGLNPGQQEALRLLNEQEALAGNVGAIGPNKAEAAAKRRGDPLFEAMQRRDENARRMAALDREMAESRSRASQFDGAGGGLDESKISAAGDATRRKVDVQFAIERSHADRMKSLASDVNEHYDRLDREAAERTEQRRQLAVNAFSSVAGATTSALQKAARGQKTSLKEFVGSIGDALVAQGVADTVRAGAMFFDPLRAGFAPGLLAAAGVEIATGMSLGAAGGGARGAGGGGARAGHARSGESGADYLDRTRAASPSSRGGAYGGEGRTTVVHVNMPTVISPSAADGARVQQALREASRAGFI